MRAPSLERAIEARDKIATEAQTLLTRADATADEMEDVNRRLAEAGDEVERQQASIDEVQRIMALPAAERSRYMASGDGARVESPEFMRRADDPWNGDGARSFGGSSPQEYRDRALTAIERTAQLDLDGQGRAETVVRDQVNDVHGLGSRWALAVSDPSYRSAFNKLIRGPQFGLGQLEGDERRAFMEADAIRSAMNEGTTTAGGYLVPPELDPAIHLTNTGTMNPWRRIARTVQTVSNQWQPVTSAGVTAEWMTESTEASDASPTIARPTITVYREDAYIQASFEVVSDSDISTEVGSLIADAFDRLEGTAFALGTGGGQPYGVVTRVSAVSAARVAGSSGAAGAADFVLADVYAVDNALPARYRQQGASWVAHRAVLNKIRRFGEGVTANAAFWTDLGAGIPPLLLGNPVHESSDMDSTIVSGSNDDVLLLGSFNPNYTIVDRVGTVLLYQPMVVGSNRRPTGEVGWLAIRRVGADVLENTATDAFRLLRL